MVGRPNHPHTGYSVWMAQQSLVPGVTGNYLWIYLADVVHEKILYTHIK